MPIPAQRYIALDIHDETVRVCAITLTAAQMVDEYEFELNERALERFLLKLKPTDRVCFESTRNSRLFYRKICPLVAEVLVANPKKVRLITQSNDKMDRNDAFHLAFLHAAGMLPTVWMPDEQTRQDREVLKAYQDLRREQTRYYNRIRALLAENGLKWDGADLGTRPAQAFLRRVQTRLPDGTKHVLGSYLGRLEALESELARLTAVLTVRAEGRWETNLLLTIPGMDVLTAFTVLAYVGPIERFASPGSLAKYAGIVSRFRASAGKVKKGGRITKQGPRALRWAVNLVAQNLSHRPGPYRNLFRRVKRKSGEPGIAIVACGRKLLEAIWHMLTYQEPFEEEDPNLTERKIQRKERRLEASRKLLINSEKKLADQRQRHLALLQELARSGATVLPMPAPLLPSFGRKRAVPPKPAEPGPGPAAAGAQKQSA